MNLVEIRDKENDFKLVAKISFELASCLNVGDSFLPEGTGFEFKVVDKLIHIQDHTIFGNEYNLQLNVVEYITFLEKLKKAYGIKPYSYWDFKQNKL
jgi:hypothetical protein